MICPVCGGEMVREPVAHPTGDWVAWWWVCDPCPGIGVGRYTILESEPLACVGEGQRN